MTDYALMMRRLANFNNSGMSEIAKSFQYGQRHAPAQKDETPPCAEKDCG